MSDECTCPCHANGFALHMVPCCETCKTCGKQIALERLARHEETCGAGAQDIEALLVAALKFYATPADDGGRLARRTITQIQASLAESN